MKLVSVILLCWEWALLRVRWSAIFHSPSMKTRHKTFLCFHTEVTLRAAKTLIRFRSISNSSTPVFHFIPRPLHNNKHVIIEMHPAAERRCVQPFSSISNRSFWKISNVSWKHPVTLLSSPSTLLPFLPLVFFKIIYSLWLSRLSHSQLHAIHKLIPR